MAHRLEPHAGHPYLEPTEVARRLAEEFAFCDVDADLGADHVGDMLAKLIELKAPQAMIDQLSSGRELALHITVSDDQSSDVYLSFNVQPDDPPFIDYYSGQHEAATRPLLERCAVALGYRIVLV